MKKQIVVKLPKYQPVIDEMETLAERKKSKFIRKRRIIKVYI